MPVARRSPCRGRSVFGAPRRRLTRVQLHLLDAHLRAVPLAFRTAPHAGADGQPVGATLGVVESTLSLFREDGVTHLGAATDHVIRSWRNDRFAGYKTDAGMPPELLAQFPLVETALEAIGVVLWPMVEFEADDALGAAAARWAEDPALDPGHHPVTRQGHGAVRPGGRPGRHV